MVAYRRRADTQACGDLFVLQTFADKHDDLPLPLCESGDFDRFGAGLSPASSNSPDGPAHVSRSLLVASERQRRGSPVNLTHLTHQHSRSGPPSLTVKSAIETVMLISFHIAKISPKRFMPFKR